MAVFQFNNLIRYLKKIRFIGNGCIIWDYYLKLNFKVLKINSMIIQLNK